MAEFKYPYEQAAMRGDEMPDGLAFVDQYIFLALRNLYRAAAQGTITREQGSAEKKRLILGANGLKSAQDYYTEWLPKWWARIESAALEYGQNRTIEAADKFAEAVYNCKQKKKEEQA